MRQVGNNSKPATNVNGLEIKLQTDHFLVVEKPAGLLSVPGREGPLQDCVINRLKPTYPTALIVHRLDMDTSGLMIIPLKKSMQTAFGNLFQQRKIEKTYVADVWGRPYHNSGSITLPIIADVTDPPRQKICHQQGKPSLTHFRICQKSKSSPTFTRVRLKPETGRTHQLRLHLAAIGHPILGCDLYAHTEALRIGKRLHLHASELSFCNPYSDKTIVIQSSKIPFATSEYRNQERKTNSADHTLTAVSLPYKN